MAGERDDRGEEQEVYAPTRPHQDDEPAAQPQTWSPDLERDIEDYLPIPERG